MQAQPMTIWTIVVALLAGTIFGQLNKTDKVVAQHIEVEANIRILALELPSQNYTIKHTKGSRILVETNISLDDVNEHLLKYLIGTGRYRLQLKKDLTAQTISLSPNSHLKNVLVVKGKEIQETLHYTIYVPDAHIDYVEEPNELAVH